VLWWKLYACYIPDLKENEKQSLYNLIWEMSDCWAELLQFVTLVGALRWRKGCGLMGWTVVPIVYGLMGCNSSVMVTEKFILLWKTIEIDFSWQNSFKMWVVIFHIRKRMKKQCVYKFTDKISDCWAELLQLVTHVGALLWWNKYWVLLVGLCLLYVGLPTPS